MFPLEDYYKLDPDNKMETYEFGIIYIREEDKFQMQEIDTAFDYIPDETNTSVIYTKDNNPISVGVKQVKFCEEKCRRNKLTWHVLFLQYAKMKVAIVNLNKFYICEKKIIVSQSPELC